MPHFIILQMSEFSWELNKQLYCHVPSLKADVDEQYVKAPAKLLSQPGPQT